MCDSGACLLVVLLVVVVWWLVVSWGGLRGVLGFLDVLAFVVWFGVGLSVICFRVSCGFLFGGCLCLGDWFASWCFCGRVGFPGLVWFAWHVGGFDLAVPYAFLWVWCGMLFARFGFLA